MIKRSCADLAVKLIAIGEQVGKALFRDPAAGDGVHKFWEFHKFRGDVVESVACVFERALVCPRIIGMIQSGFEGPGYDEETGNTYRSERVETVRILDDCSFEGSRPFATRIAMGAHGCRNMSHAVLIYLKLIETVGGEFRRTARRFSRLPGAFR
jgi:hypothetical protein